MNTRGGEQGVMSDVRRELWRILGGRHVVGLAKGLILLRLGPNYQV